MGTESRKEVHGGGVEKNEGFLLRWVSRPHLFWKLRGRLKVILPSWFFEVAAF